MSNWLTERPTGGQHTESTDSFVSLFIPFIEEKKNIFLDIHSSEIKQKSAIRYPMLQIEVPDY